MFDHDICPKRLGGQLSLSKSSPSWPNIRMVPPPPFYRTLALVLASYLYSREAESSTFGPVRNGPANVTLRWMIQCRPSTGGLMHAKRDAVSRFFSFFSDHYCIDRLVNYAARHWLPEPEAAPFAAII